MMLAYAGIGSRRITNAEEAIIKKVASKLSNHFILYSGNADGSDITFQNGSGGNCVLMLPWYRFNNLSYDLNMCQKALVVGDTEEGLESVVKYHPNASRLSKGGRALMCRNYHQIHGYGSYPMVRFVVCCADQKGDTVIGGTGQAVRIAQDNDIPVVNLRREGWQKKLKTICLELTQ